MMVEVIDSRTARDTPPMDMIDLNHYHAVSRADHRRPHA